MVAQFI